MPRDPRITEAEKSVKLAVKRCAADLARGVRGVRPPMKIGGKIDCGVQGCVHNATLGGKPVVVKITTAGDVSKLRADAGIRERQRFYRGIDFQHELRRRSGRDTGEYEDYVASLKVRDWERTEGRARLHPMLPRFKKIGIVQDCLRERARPRHDEDVEYEDGPALAHLAFREDLPDLPPHLKRAVRRADRWVESLERAMKRGVRASDWMDSHRWDMQEDLRRHPDANAFMVQYYDFQKWLEKRGARMYDMHEGNFGVRRLGRNRVQIVVRDIGRLLPLPRRRAGIWEKERLERRHGRYHQPLAGYDAGD